MGRTHMTTGVTAGAWLATAGAVAGVPAPLLVLAIPLAAYSAILPDLDHPNSTATYSLGPVTMVVSWILRRFVDHRGPTHRPRWSPAFGAAVALPTIPLPAPLGGWSAVWWFLVVSLGCVTHVWGDARTLSGVPWSATRRDYRVGPVVVATARRARLRIGRSFRTGSEHEEWRLHRIYGPTAFASVALAAVVLRAVTG